MYTTRSNSPLGQVNLSLPMREYLKDRHATINSNPLHKHLIAPSSHMPVPTRNLRISKAIGNQGLHTG